MRTLGCANSGSRRRDRLVKDRQMMNAGQETAHRPPMRSRSVGDRGLSTDVSACH